MQIMTKALRDKLMDNAAAADEDLPPVLKVFNPCGNQTWLFSELKEDGDTLWGLCDLGLGSPEIGYASLKELASIRVMRGALTLERDRHFEACAPLSVYAEVAVEAGAIVEDPAKIKAALEAREGN